MTKMIYRNYKRILLSFMLACFLSATAEAAQVTLTWQDNSTNEDGFNVQRKLLTDPPSAYKTISTTGPNTNTVVDSTVVAGSTYCYQVNAFNKSGVSPWSAEACMLTTPTGIVLTYTP